MPTKSIPSSAITSTPDSAMVTTASRYRNRSTVNAARTKFPHEDYTIIPNVIGMGRNKE